ncbi:aminotransferase class IV [Pontibacter toksunensis]|uniref:branched-chain-amino-acid transaminase n=1 Tax=Pontibacter toksunensis TaxID=1332631 RepID=A0ABW6BPZ5_9BACT
MQLLYNNHLLHESELRLPLSNRAFQFNDGFFETIIIRRGSLCFWQDHLLRMQEAAAALHLALPPYFTLTSFEEKLLKLAAKQQATAYARLKLKVWRSGGGLYTPETNQVEWLATAQQATPPSALPLQVGLCRQVRTQYSPLSHFKGPNAPMYVLAAMEKDKRNLDDLVLLDLQNKVSELTSSNILWVRENRVFTPALSTGCINGVLRRNIVRWCQQHKVEVAEVLGDIDQLYHSDGVFSANVTGIKRIAAIEEVSVSTRHPLVEQLARDLSV